MRDSDESKRPHNLLDLVVKEPGFGRLPKSRSADYTCSNHSVNNYFHYFPEFFHFRSVFFEVVFIILPGEINARWGNGAT